jgi:hypothetical protein
MSPKLYDRFQTSIKRHGTVIQTHDVKDITVLVQTADSIYSQRCPSDRQNFETSIGSMIYFFGRDWYMYPILAMHADVIGDNIFYSKLIGNIKGYYDKNSRQLVMTGSATRVSKIEISMMKFSPFENAVTQANWRQDSQITADQKALKCRELIDPVDGIIYIILHVFVKSKKRNADGNFNVLIIAIDKNHEFLEDSEFLEDLLEDIDLIYQYGKVFKLSDIDMETMKFRYQLLTI